MPGINIIGGSPSGPGGGDGSPISGALEGALAALTSAVNANTAAVRGGGGPGGGGGGGPRSGQTRGPYGTRDQWANARTMNANFNAVRAQAERENRWFIQNDESRYRAKQQASRKDEIWTTQNENARFRTRQQEAKREDIWTTQNENARFRTRQQDSKREDAWITQNENARFRFRERQARTQAASLARINRGLSSWTAAGAPLYSAGTRRAADLENQNSDAAYRRSYAEAMLENSSRDAAARRPPPRAGSVAARFQNWQGMGWNQRLSPSGLGGLTSGLMTNSITGTVISGVIAAVAAPVVIAALTRQVMSLAKPSFDFDRGTMSMGMAGGFDSAAMREAFHPADGSTPDWMTQFGYRPEDAVSLAGKLGLNRDASGTVDILKSLGAAEYSPGMGLSRDQLASGFSQATSLGAVNPDSAQSRDDYFNRLQKTMIVAQTYSLNHAESQQRILSLMERSAAAGAARNNGSAYQDAWSRGVASGSPGGLSGATVAAGQAGMDAMSSNAGPGGNPLQNLAMQQYFKGSPPKNIDELRKYFDQNGHTGDFDNAMKNDRSFNALVQNYMGATAANNRVAQYGFIGQMNVGRSDLQQGIGSAFNPIIPGYLRPGTTGNISGSGTQYARMYASSPPAEQADNAGNFPPGTPRGIRNNNPLNLSFLPGQGALHGDAGSGRTGNYGVYATMQAGIAAEERQLLGYKKRGLDTPRSIISEWAKGDPNASAYAANVAGALGISPDDKIDMADPAVAAKVITSMGWYENSRQLDPKDVQGGIAMALGGNIPSAANASNAKAGQIELRGSDSLRPLADGLGGQGGDIISSLSTSLTNLTTEAAKAALALAGLAGAASHPVDTLGRTTPHMMNPLGNGSLTGSGRTDWPLGPNLN